MKKNRLFKILIFLICILAISLVLEILIGNKFSNLGLEEVIQAESVVSENGNQIVSFSFDKQYVKKISFDTDVNHDINYYVTITAYNGYDKPFEKKVEDVVNNEFNKAVTNVFIKADNIKITFVNTDFYIESLVISNQFQINWYRLIFIIAVLISLAFILLSNELIQNRLEIVFAISCFIIGMLIIIMVGPDLKSWDEHIHFQRIYDLSFTTSIKNSKSTLFLENLQIPVANTYEEKNMLNEYINANGSIDNYISSKEKGLFVAFNQRGYLSQSLMLKFARWLNLPFNMLVLFGRLGNLLLYIGLCFAAIKYIPYGKRLVTMVALLPTPIFLASSFSYDPIVIAGCMLAFSIFLYELLQPDKKLNIKTVIIFVLAMIFASFPKAVYIPLILLALLYDKEKFNSDRQMRIFKTGIILIFILVLCTFVLPTLSGDITGDSRGGNTSVPVQIKLIMMHPITYAKLLLGTIGKTLLPYFIGSEGILHYAYLGVISHKSTTIGIIASIIIAIVAITNTEACLSKKHKIFIGTIVFIIICLINTALYLSFTPIGLSQINGVQARYYIPLLVPVLFIFSNRKIQLNINDTKYNKIIVASICGISFYGVYVLIISKFCI